MTDTLVGRLDKYAAEVQAATAVIKRQARIIDAHQQQIIDAGEIMKHWQSRALAAESSLSEAVKAAREQAFEEAARICDNWIGTFGSTDIKYTPATEYAVGAVEDIAEVLRTPADREPALEAIASAIRSRAAVLDSERSSTQKERSE